MISNQKQKINWHQIVIFDENALSGNSIFDLIQIILNVINFKFIVLDDISGALVFPLQQMENEVIELNDLLKLIFNVKQFDWGDFFMFKEYPQNWSNHKGEPYSCVIAQTSTTIRAVDDTYLYIYTPYKEIVAVIKKNYKVESIKMNSLDKLDYPE